MSRIIFATAIAAGGLTTIGSGSAAASVFHSDPPAVVVQSDGAGVVLRKELGGYPNYGVADGGSDILYSSEADSWTFDLTGVPLPGFVSAELHISLALDDHYGRDASDYVGRIVINGEQVFAGAWATDLGVPHGEPYGRVFDNWRRVCVGLTDPQRPAHTISLLNDTTGGVFGDWIAVDRIDLHLRKVGSGLCGSPPANVGPSARTGGPYTVPEGGSVGLDGRGSTDPDGDALSYSWNLDDDGTFETAGPTPVFSAAGRDGPSTVAIVLQVCDPTGACAREATSVAVTNLAPLPDVGADRTVFRNEALALSGTWSDPAGALDNPYAWAWDVPGNPTSGTAAYGTTLSSNAAFPTEGTYTVALKVTDDDGAMGADTALIRVLNRPPSCAGTRPSVAALWPPNHRFVEVGILGLSDGEGDPLAVVITSIRQDEAVNAKGDGNTHPDGSGVGTSVASVRAERSGGGDGRVYHLGFIATDGHGGSCTGVVKVAVTHDQSGRGAVDGGPLHDSTRN